MRIYLWLFMALILTGVVAGSINTAEVEVWTTFDAADRTDYTYADVSNHSQTLTLTGSNYPDLDVSSEWNEATDWEYTAQQGHGSYFSGYNNPWWESLDDDRSIFIKVKTENTNDGGNTHYLYYEYDDAGLIIMYEDGGNLITKLYDTGYRTLTVPVSDNTYYNIILTYSGSEAKIYINGVLKGSIAVSTLISKTNGLSIANPFNSDNYGWDGYIDEFAIWDTVITATGCPNVGDTCTGGDVYEIEQSTHNPFTYSSTSNFTVTTYDYWDSSAVNNITVTIDSTNYTNTTGNKITSLILQNDSSLHNVTVYNNEHFTTRYYDLNVSTNLNAYMNASDIKFRGFNIFGEEFLSNFTIASSIKESNQSFPLSAGNHTVTVSRTGYFPYSEVVNVSSLDNKTINITGLYNINLSVEPRDVLNNNSISGANITIENSSRGVYQTFSNVSSAQFSIMEGCYNLSIVASERNDYWESLCLNNTGNITHYSYLYAYNSIWVYAHDILNSTNISVFNVTIQNANYSYFASASSGVAMFSDVLSGVYDVIVSAPNYDSASYVVTVTDNSFQTLDAYLIQKNGTFIFTIKDKGTNGLLEGVAIAMKRYINSTLTTVSVKYSDITGRAQFNYNDDVTYYFSLSKTGYEDKDFSLEIIFSEYSVLMTPLATHNESVYIDDVTLRANGYRFTNGTSWVSYLFDSPLGSLEGYNISVLLPNGSAFVSSGSVAGGSTLNVSVDTPSVRFGDVAVVTLEYKSSYNAGVSSRTYIYPFDTFSPSDSSLSYLVVSLDDSSDLSQSFWGTVFVLAITAIFGVFGLFIGDLVLSGSIGGIIGFVVVGSLELFNWTVSGIAIFILLMLVVGRLMNNG